MQYNRTFSQDQCLVIEQSGLQFEQRLRPLAVDSRGRIRMRMKSGRRAFMFVGVFLVCSGIC